MAGNPSRAGRGVVWEGRCSREEKQRPKKRNTHDGVRDGRWAGLGPFMQEEHTALDLLCDCKLAEGPGAPASFVIKKVKPCRVSRQDLREGTGKLLHSTC